MSEQDLEPVTDTVSVTPTDTVSVTPTDFTLRLRLGSKRYSRRLVVAGEPVSKPVMELQARLNRASAYIINRLQRRFPQLAVSRPHWSYDADAFVVNVPGVVHCAYLQFGYIDMSPYCADDRPRLAILKDLNVEIMPNRAQRRAP